LPKLHAGGALWFLVSSLLTWCCSPQQIAHTLRRTPPHDPSRRISHESIYNAIYAHPKGELRKQLRLAAPGQEHAPATLGRQGGRHGQIPEMLSIHVRPPEVQDRVMPGHWEGDLIKGAGNRSSVGMLFERCTRLVLLCKRGFAVSGVLAADAGYRVTRSG